MAINTLSIQISPMITNFPAWHNGQFCTVKDLTVSVLDLGLIHSDATYDVISSHNRRIFRLDDHLDRFYTSCDFWRLTPTISREEMKNTIIKLCYHSNTDDLLIWIGITRGTPSSGNPRDLSSYTPNMFMYVKPYFGFNPANSARVCLATQKRNTSFNQRYKNFAWNDLTVAQWEAVDRGYDTALLLDENEYLTEGPGFNVFCIKDNQIITPSHNCLGGVTINALEEICQENNILFERKNITLKELNDVDYISLASTAGNFIPVTEFEGRLFNHNELFDNLQSLIKEHINGSNRTTLY